MANILQELYFELSSVIPFFYVCYLAKRVKTNFLEGQRNIRSLRQFSQYHAISYIYYFNLIQLNCSER